MSQTRKIRQNERDLIVFLLEKLNLNVADYPINEEVFEYEGGKMGSISLNNNPDAYAGDLIQVEYIDTNNTPVMITPCRLPLFDLRLKVSANSCVSSCGSTPIQPRTTWPSLTKPSITMRAVETGMAKPMPMLPPERL